MNISQRIHHQIRIKSILISLVFLIFLAILAWLSTRFYFQSDWTADRSNSLSETSLKVLDSMADDLSITAYTSGEQQLKKQILRVINSYAQHKANLKIRFKLINADPEASRELGITDEGAIILEYQGRMEKLQTLNESALSNALLRLSYANQRWISFLSGHGERAPNGTGNHDLTLFSKTLKRRKIQVISTNLASLSAIPDNSSLLVIASPQLNLLEGETNIILQYLQQGGNLLWLLDPDDESLEKIAEYLGVVRLPGTIVDISSQLYGIDNPSYVLATEYPDHPLTQGFKATTLFPVSAALTLDDDFQEGGFSAAAVISSAYTSWTEIDNLTGAINFDADADEQEGPLTFAYALTRHISTQKQQRILIIGDGDFLADAFINHVGNRDLGIRMINWLTYDDRFIDIPTKTAIDQSLALSQFSIMVIAYGFLLILPITFLTAGFIIWRIRKRR